MSKAALAHFKHIASAETVNGRPRIEDPLFRARIAEVEMRLMAVEMSTLRILAATRMVGCRGGKLVVENPGLGDSPGDQQPDA